LARVVRGKNGGHPWCRAGADRAGPRARKGFEGVGFAGGGGGVCRCGCLPAFGETPWFGPAGKIPPGPPPRRPGGWAGAGGKGVGPGGRPAAESFGDDPPRGAGQAPDLAGNWGGQPGFLLRGG